MSLRSRDSQQMQSKGNYSSHTWYWLRKVSNGTETKYRRIYLSGNKKWPNAIICVVYVKKQMVRSVPQ